MKLLSIAMILLASSLISTDANLTVLECHSGGGGWATAVNCPCGSTDKGASLRSRSHDDSGGKVTLGLYVEALCPYCQATMTKGWMKDLMSGQYDDILSIMDLVIVPYGNAKVEKNGTVVCQHGPNECLANAYELCSLVLMGKNETSAIATGVGSRGAWPFLYCLEMAKGNVSSVGECAKHVPGGQLSAEALEGCVAHQYDEVMAQGAAATDSLCFEPCGCHSFVPWTVVDGSIDVWGKDGQPDTVDDVIRAVCDTYTGKNKRVTAPELCAKARRGGR